jgi:hypothetical protein
MTARDHEPFAPRRIVVGNDRAEFTFPSYSLVLLIDASDVILELTIPLGEFCCHDICRARRVNPARWMIFDGLPEIELVRHCSPALIVALLRPHRMQLPVANTN